MFKQTQTVDTRMAVMEEKFNVYEKMMDKLESAIQTISEINQNISRMLTIHEEKIDNGIKNDDILYDKLRRIEEKNTEEHQKVVDRLEKLSADIKKSIDDESRERQDNINSVTTKINDIVKFRWLIVGGLAVATFIIANSTIIVDFLTPDSNPAIIHKVK